MVGSGVGGITITVVGAGSIDGATSRVGVGRGAVINSAGVAFVQAATHKIINQSAPILESLRVIATGSLARNVWSTQVIAILAILRQHVPDKT